MPNELSLPPQPVPLDEQIKSVEREIAVRVRVYPRWVVDRRLTQAKADHEIAAMKAVLATLQKAKRVAE